MTLQELTEPLFQYVCRLNRSARGGASPDQLQVRADVKGLLADMKAQAVAQPGLLEQYNQIELVLMFFVDFMIKESTLPFARKWPDLAHEVRELGGEQKFFDLLDVTLKDSSKAATERLTIFYTCLTLGFTGWYTGQPEYLRRAAKQIYARTGDLRESRDAAKICPDAYEHVDTRDLVEPPGTKLVGIAVALGVFFVVLFIANVYLYRSAIHDLSESLTTITSAK